MNETPPALHSLAAGGVILNNYADVHLDHKTVGTANIKRNGLYYQIHCRCNVPDDRVYRLMAKCDGRSVDLGVCVPFEDGFGVDTMVSVKKIGTDSISFYLTDRKESSDEKFIQIKEGEPFDGTEHLMNSRFEMRGNAPGLVIKMD